MPTRNIDVQLNITANPPVILSTRNQQVSAGDTIKWKKKDNNDSFTITSLDPNVAPFSQPVVGGGGNNLSCTYEPGNNPGPFPYTLTVTSAGQTYNTTDTSRKRDEGRPVIRN
jgi:plastocyanin